MGRAFQFLGVFFIAIVFVYWIVGPIRGIPIGEVLGRSFPALFGGMFIYGFGEILVRLRAIQTLLERNAERP
jgi:hypothetical protein